MCQPLWRISSFGWMPTDATSHLLKLVTIALDELEAVSITASVRRAWRIARLRGDMHESLRFALELGTEEHFDELEPSSEINVLRAYIERQLQEDRRSRVDPNLLGLESIEQLTMQPLWNLPVAQKAYEVDLSLQSRIQNENRRVVSAQIIEQVRNYVCQYLMKCETTLRLAVKSNEIIDRYRERVDRVLTSLAPDILAMLNSAISRAFAEDEPEARVHALTSCRRVLVAVADYVFPPSDVLRTDSQGVERQVGLHQYRNRILAALEIAGGSTLHRALGAHLSDFSVRLDRLDELTQKGVHDFPTAADVDFGVVQTYILAGEVLAVTKHI